MLHSAARRARRPPPAAQHQQGRANPLVEAARGSTGAGPSVPGLRPCQVSRTRQGCRERLAALSERGAGPASPEGEQALQTICCVQCRRVRRSSADDARPCGGLDARRVRLSLHAVRRAFRLVSSKAPLQVLRAHLLQRVLLSPVRRVQVRARHARPSVRRLLCNRNVH